MPDLLGILTISFLWDRDGPRSSAPIIGPRLGIGKSFLKRESRKSLSYTIEVRPIERHARERGEDHSLFLAQLHAKKTKREKRRCGEEAVGHFIIWKGAHLIVDITIQTHVQEKAK